MKSRVLRLLAAAAFIAVGFDICAAPPAWWSEQGVLTTGATANDYAAANLGQVKRIATLAYNAMNAKIPGGAGSDLTTLINSWSQAPAAGVVRNDYAAVNQGQLKALAKLFYDRLAAVGYHGVPLAAGQTYPWTTTTADDNNYAAVNLGQVKYLFSFDLSAFDAQPPSGGMGLWLKADAGVTSDGNGNVTAWVDQSGNSNNATQSNSANAPTTVANVLNGRPVVRFSASQSQSLNLPSFLGSATAGEVFVVLKAATATPSANRGLWQMGTAGGGGSANSFYPLSGGEVTEDFGSTSGHSLSVPPAGIGSFILYNISSASGSWIARLNGAVQLQVNSNTVAFPASMQLGYRGAYDYFDGDIAEVIIYNRVLSTTERDTVGRYLQYRYNLASMVAPTNPTNLTATPISSTQVSLTWSDALSATGTVYTIERQVGTNGFTLLAEVTNSLSYIDAELSAGGTYTYRISSRNYAGTSPGYSNTATATTLTSGADLPVTGMRLWLNADSGIASTGRVARWQDLSGLGNDAVQSSTGNEPQVVTNSPGRPVVRFAASQGQYLNLGNLMSGATAGEVFAVVKAAAPAPSGNRGLWHFGMTSSNGSANSFYPLSGGGVSEDFGSTNGHSLGTPAAGIDNLLLYDVSSAPGVWIARFNGVVQYQTSANTVLFPSSPQLGFRGAYDYFDGDIAEIIVYDHVLSAAERSTASAYLQGKYGLAALPSVPPTPQSLAVQAVSSSEVALTWSEASTASGITYVVERQTGSGGFVAVGQVTDAFGYVDTDLAANTTYSYRILAQNGVGSSAYTSVMSTTTLTGYALPTQNLQMWLSADNGVVLQSNKVSVWHDRSGHAMDATQSNTNNQPTVTQNVGNGLPAIHFDGGSSALILPQFMTNATEADLFLVVRASATPPLSGADARVLAFVNQNGGTSYPTANGQISDGFGSSTQNTFSSGASQLTQLQIYNVTATSTGWVARLNGRTVFTKTTNSVNFTNTDFAPVLGADRSGPYYSLANWFQGDVAEVAVYNHALSSADRTTVGAYFAKKYNLPVTAPTAPSNVLAASVSSTQVSLAWQGSDPTASYVVERQNPDGTYQVVATLNGVLGYLDAGLTPGTAYTYRIKAQNYGGSSDYSTLVTTATSAFMPTLPQSGMCLWLAPESLPVTTATLQAWPDMSGTGNTALQNTAANQPAVVTNAVNGRPVVHFNGASSYLNLPDILAGSSAAEVFMVVRASSSAGSSGQLWTYGSTNYPFTDGQIHDGFASTTMHTLASPGVDLTQAHIYNANSSATEWAARLDGQVLFSTPTNTVATAAVTGGSVIGAVHSGAYYSLGNWFSGDVAEVVVYNRVLTSSERESVNYYLNQKYQCSSSSYSQQNYFNYDADGDGVTNTQEASLGTDPYNPSNNGSGIPDGWALAHGLNPLDPAIAVSDAMNDGLSNLEKYLRGLDPQLPQSQDPAAPINLRVYVPSQR